MMRSLSDQAKKHQQPQFGVSACPLRNAPYFREDTSHYRKWLTETHKLTWFPLQRQKFLFHYSRIPAHGVTQVDDVEVDSVAVGEVLPLLSLSSNCHSHGWTLKRRGMDRCIILTWRLSDLSTALSYTNSSGFLDFKHWQRTWTVRSGLLCLAGFRQFY